MARGQKNIEYRFSRTSWLDFLSSFNKRSTKSDTVERSLWQVGSSSGLETSVHELTRAQNTASKWIQLKCFFEGALVKHFVKETSVKLANKVNLARIFQHRRKTKRLIIKSESEGLVSGLWLQENASSALWLQYQCDGSQNNNNNWNQHWPTTDIHNRPVATASLPPGTEEFLARVQNQRCSGSACVTTRGGLLHF